MRILWQPIEDLAWFSLLDGSSLLVLPQIGLREGGFLYHANRFASASLKFLVEI